MAMTGRFSYADLAPYYDIVEKYVGITGAAEGNEMLPDGQFLPPMKMSCGEILSARARQEEIRTHPHHRPRRDSDSASQRPRALATTAALANAAASTFSYFSSPFTTVNDALNSGNCTLITDAIVSHVDMDPHHQQSARRHFRRSHSRSKTKQVRGKAVILCAQAMESTRILLNSSTREYPKGLGNSSGLLGPLFDGPCRRRRRQRDF